MSVGESLYSGAATLGKVDAIMGVIGGGIAVLVICIIGSVMLSIKDKVVTDATVKTVNCKTSKPDSMGDNNCDVKIVYNVGKNEIENYIKDTNKKPINSKISILYQPDNPTQFEIKQDNHMSASTMGYIMIAAGFVFGILIGMNYYFVSKYKPYAALTGLNRTGKFISDML